MTLPRLAAELSTRPLPGALRRGMPGSLGAGIGELGGRRVVIVETTSRNHLGAFTPADGDKLVAAAELALSVRLPLVAVLASSGADVNAGIGAVAGWGRAARAIVACSGSVPVLFGVDGPAVSGPALLLGLADHVVMTARSYAFVSGPAMVAQFTGIPVSIDQLGGTDVHQRSSGAASLVVADRDGLYDALGAILDHLPDHADAVPPRLEVGDRPDRDEPDPGALLPITATGSYDVRTVLTDIVDDGAVLELRAGWAPNLVTAFATVDGRAVGIVANQPQQVAGTLDIAASQKGARFVAFCDTFGLPLLTFVDTPGFYPGKDLEWRGMIRHGAQLAFSYARATVPRICVTLRKSYGGAFIVMDSRAMGNDLHLAWPGAEIAVMGARGAVEILHRGVTADERNRLEADYEARLLNPYVAAERGIVDRVIEPRRTRAELCAALGVLSDKRETLAGRRHDNSPL